MKQYSQLLSFSRLLRLVAIASIPVLVSSCLSLEAEFDLRRPGQTDLTIHYHLHESLWELGVFDENSPERAVPVSRRDAEETALRYRDVTLQDHRVLREGERVTVTVRYRAGSTESLQGLWGEAGGGPLTVRGDGRGITIPLAAQSSPVEANQRELFDTILRNEFARITVLAPETVRSGSAGGAGVPGEEERAGNRYTFTVPMADLLAAPQPFSLEVEW